MRDPLPAHERARILDLTARLLAERQEEAAQIVSAEAGKPLKAARVEAQRAVSTYTFSAVEARKLTGETVPMDASAAGEGKLALTLRLPIGIVGAISPFNFPLNLVAHKIAPALAAGCAVVLKPASATPLAAFFLAELEEEAGLPPGWLNVVSGAAGEIGDVLSRTSACKLITFTGSGDVGWGIAERGAPEARQARARQRHPGDRLRRRARRHRREARGERVLVRGPELHLGAADLRRRRAPGTRSSPSSSRRSRRCTSATPPTETTDVGPVISERERERILRGSSESKGEVLTGGAATDDGVIRPTVIAGPGARRQGAVRGGLRPRRDADPGGEPRRRDRAARTRRGTACRPRSSRNDLGTCLDAARRLEFGGVIVNEAPTFRADQMPYGGVKASGNTREGPAWTVREMTEERLVVLQA